MPSEQAINKGVSIDDLCMLANEHPELSMPCCVLHILWPLLLHGDRVPGTFRFICHLQEH